MFTSRSVQVRALGVKGCTLVLVLVALLTSGCSAVNGLAGTLFVRTLTAPSTAALSLEEARHNRLLVISADGNLFTISPSSRNRLDLTRDAGRNRLYAQPTWSPDGARIAYSQIERAGSSLLVTVRADGSGRRAATVPFPPFYIFWNPVGDGLAYLSNWVAGRQPTLALHVVDLSRPRPALQILSLGQPLYFSWSPNGEQLLTHTGNREVARAGLDGSRRVLAARSANFAAPQWLHDGNHLLYAIDAAGQQQIVVADLQGNVEQSIAVNGTASFEINVTGDRLAFVDTPQPMGTNTLGPLYLFEIDEQRYRQLSTEPVIFFTWSPDGSALLYMTAEPHRGQLWLRAHVWNGEKSISLSRFRPSSVFFEQYLRFADQYAQSQRYWSPDSHAIVFSGTGEDGRSGVWIQAVDGESAPVLVTEGVYATWSPQ